MTETICPIAQGARKHPERPALITGNRVSTYQDCHHVVSFAAVGLRQAGIGDGTRVAIVAASYPELPLLLFALFRIGAVACLISPRLPARTVKSYLDSVGCAFAIDPGDQLTRSIAIPVIAVSLPIPDEQRMQRLGEAVDEAIPLSRDATIVATSGTTSEPKAVLHTYGNHYWNALGSNRNVAVGHEDRWLLTLPLFHVGGLGILFRTFMGGGSIVIPGRDDSLPDCLAEYHVTHLSLVYTQLHRLLQIGPPPKAVERLKAVLVGGSPVPASLIKDAHDCRLPVCVTYGLTEMASQVTTTSPGDGLERLRSAGKCLDYRQLKVAEGGEILVRGETLFRGYVRRDTVNLPVDSNGWFHTGDLGTLSLDGYLSVRGRRDNMFVSGGENVYPEEIEAALRLLDHVEDALVLPVEDPDYGRRPVAFVRLSRGYAPSRTELMIRLALRLPRFKLPIRLYEWPEAARRGDWKPSRSRFRDLLTGGYARELI